MNKSFVFIHTGNIAEGFTNLRIFFQFSLKITNIHQNRKARLLSYKRAFMSISKKLNYFVLDLYFCNGVVL